MSLVSIRSPAIRYWHLLGFPCGVSHLWERVAGRPRNRFRSVTLSSAWCTRLDLAIGLPRRRRFNPLLGLPDGVPPVGLASTAARIVLIRPRAFWHGRLPGGGTAQTHASVSFCPRAIRYGRREWYEPLVRQKRQFQCGSDPTVVRGPGGGDGALEGVSIQYRFPRRWSTRVA